MYKFYFNKKPVVENSQITSVSVFVRHNLLQINEQMGKLKKRKLDLNNEEDVKSFIEIVEQYIKLNLKQENGGEVSFTELNPVKLTYTKSNLGKGFVFWFICNRCGRRVRNLYFPPNSEVLACRRCHRLSYRTQNENDTRAARSYRKLFGFE